MIEPTSNGAVTAAPRPKQLRIVYHPGERAVFTVISDAEFSLLNWCHRQAGQKMDRGYEETVFRALVSACKTFGESNLYTGDDGKLYIA